MVAERALEHPFSQEVVQQSPGLHLEIVPGSRQRTEVYHGKARVSRFVTVPYTFEMPQGHVSSDVIDVHLNGLAAAKPSYRAVREAGAQLGKNGVTLGVNSWLGMLSPRQLLDSERYRKEAVSATLDDIDLHFGKEAMLKYRLKSHSTGARTGVAVAEDSPERIDSVTLVNAAAIDGAGTLDYLGRLPDFYRNDIVPNRDILRNDFRDPKVMTDFFWYNLGNPFRTGLEALSISGDDIRSRVVNLGDLGVKVAILDAVSDYLTPNHTVRDGIGQLVDVYRVHPNTEIGHLGPQVYALETAMEYHSIDEELHPEEVISPRRVAVRAMARGRDLGRPDDLMLPKAS